MVRSLALRLPAGYRIDNHRHPWGQLVYATEGVMTVETEVGSWVVPSHRAAWVPGGTQHGIATTGSVRLRTLYLRPDLGVALPQTCSILSVSALLRELLLEVIRLGMLRDDMVEQGRLAAVLVDQIRLTPEEPLLITWPRDPRARFVAKMVVADPAWAGSLLDLAPGSGASARTLERLFRRETRMTFGRWRQQVRLLEALRRLAAGESVTSIALAVGFSGTSAFIAMFRRLLGEAPGHYFRDSAGS